MRQIVRENMKLKKLQRNSILEDEWDVKILKYLLNYYLLKETSKKNIKLKNTEEQYLWNPMKS